MHTPTFDMSDMPSCLYTHFVAPSDGLDVAYWSVWAREFIQAQTSDVQRCIVRLTNRECARVRVNPWHASRFGPELHSTYDVHNFANTEQCAALLGKFDVLLGKFVSIPMMGPEGTTTKLNLASAALKCKNLPLIRWLSQQDARETALGMVSMYRMMDPGAIVECMELVSEAGDLELVEQLTRRSVSALLSGSVSEAERHITKKIDNFVRSDASVDDKVKFLRRELKHRTRMKAMNSPAYMRDWASITWRKVLAYGDVRIMERVAVALALEHEANNATSCDYKVLMKDVGDQSELIVSKATQIRAMKGYPGTLDALDWMHKFWLLFFMHDGTRPWGPAIENDDAALLHKLVADPLLPWHGSILTRDDLHTAITCGKVETAMYMISMGITFGVHEWAQAIVNGDLRIVEAMIAAESDVTRMPDVYSYRVLNADPRSRECDAIKIVDLLIEHGLCVPRHLIEPAIYSRCDLLVTHLHSLDLDNNRVNKDHTHAMCRRSSRRFDEAMDKLDLGFEWV